MQDRDRLQAHHAADDHRSGALIHHDAGARIHFDFDSFDLVEQSRNILVRLRYEFDAPAVDGVCARGAERLIERRGHAFRRMEVCVVQDYADRLHLLKFERHGPFNKRASGDSGGGGVVQLPRIAGRSTHIPT
jgi:hypothetical protein